MGGRGADRPRADRLWGGSTGTQNRLWCNIHPGRKITFMPAKLISTDKVRVWVRVNTSTGCGGEFSRSPGFKVVFSMPVAGRLTALLARVFFKENLQLHKSPSLVPSLPPVPSLPFPPLPSFPFPSPSPPPFSRGPGVSPPENFWN